MVTDYSNSHPSQATSFLITSVEEPLLKIGHSAQTTPAPAGCRGIKLWRHVLEETIGHAKSAGPNRICRSTTKNCAVGKVIRSQSERSRDFLIKFESGKLKDHEASFAVRRKRVYARTKSTRHATGNGLAYRATSNIAAFAVSTRPFIFGRFFPKFAFWLHDLFESRESMLRLHRIFAASSRYHKFASGHVLVIAIGWPCAGIERTYRKKLPDLVGFSAVRCFQHFRYG